MKNSNGEALIRVLLIEDDPGDADLAKEVLSEEEGLAFEVEWADRLEAGLKRLAEGGIDVVLLDLGLPGCQRLDALKKVSQSAPSLPIVICSGLEDEEVALEAIQKGAQDYVIKGRAGKEAFDRILRYAIERRRLEELRQEFVGMVVHDLRSPLLASIWGISQMLEGHCGAMADDQRQYLSLVLSSMERMSYKIDDLLEMTNVELGKVKLAKERFDMVEMAKEVLAIFSRYIHAKGLDLKERWPQGPAQVYADKLKIEQVLTNLVSNAVKFTREGYVEVCVEENGNGVECAVTDTGCGIPQESLQSIFGKFEQLGQPSHRRERGSGLGLAIAKDIVEAHGGKIWAERREDRGSRFVFTLPKE